MIHFFEESLQAVDHVGNPVLVNGEGNPKTRKPESGIGNQNPESETGIRNPETGNRKPQITENKFFKFAKIILHSFCR